MNSYIKLLFTAFCHIIFWVGVYFFYTYFLGYGSLNVNYVNSFSWYLMPSTIVTSYLFLYYLFPFYLQKKKYFLFFLYSIYTFIISNCAIILSILFGFIFLDASDNITVIPLTKGLPFIIFGVYMVVLFSIVIGLMLFNYLDQKKTEDLKNKFLQTQLQLKEQELKFLKMQIHPHFLFNSLNTIYGFALQKGDEAPEMILKLSNLLDYILYQIEKPKVNLQQEINHLEDYISLEKMRFHDSLKVNFQKEILTENIQISPMLLIPFAENSFKHGKISNGFLEIDIKLSVTDNELVFTIQNSSKNDVNSNVGIGIENIRKRLQMLYPDKHQLKIQDKEATFSVSLKIQLKDF